MQLQKKHYIAGIIILLLITAGAIFFIFFKSDSVPKNVLEETGKMKESKNPDWWLNSGGIMNISEGSFSTNIGKLEKSSKWRKSYAKNNPEDTGDGYMPQNIFRLVNRNEYQDFSQSVYFKIDKINLTDSENRNGSNGILLFNRYQDGDNLYYTGIRVDGHAVIKKKIEGKYYTMKEKEILTKGNKYDKLNSYNFIPVNNWIGIKSEIENTDEDTVLIKLYIDLEQKGDWQLVLETTDSGDAYGENPFLEKGYAGIRTDFMDVGFKDYKVIEN